MATTYRKATEKDIAKGKGKSTDELTLAEATAYFNKRSAETGAKKFRYKGEVYDLSGEKAAAKPAASSSSSSAPTTSKRPKAKPAAPTTVASTGGGGADAGKMPATGTKPYKSSGRGDGATEASRRSKDAKAAAGRKAQEEMSDKAKKVAAGGAAIGAAVVGARAALKGAPKAPRPVAKPTVSNPTYNPRSGMKTGFQGKMETGVARPGLKTGGRGLSGNPAPFERIAGGGARPSMDGKDDKLPLFNKGGMAKKAKK